jgi:hypothetical protein
MHARRPPTLAALALLLALAAGCQGPPAPHEVLNSPVDEPVTAPESPDTQAGPVEKIPMH